MRPTDESGVIPLLAALGLIALGGLALMAIFRTIIVAVVVVVIGILLWVFAKYGVFKNKQGVVIGLAVIIVLPLFAILMLGPGAIGDPPGFDTNGWANNDVIVDGPDGLGRRSKWVFSGNFGGQILDSTKYASPFRTGGSGSTIYIAPKVCIDSSLLFWENSAKNIEYHIFSTQTSLGWGEPEIVTIGTQDSVDCSVGWTTFNVKTKEASKTGWLKVDVHAEFYNGKKYHAASDYAYIHDGVSEITKPPSGYIATVGSSFTVEFKLGWACSDSATNPGEKTDAEGGGWTAAIYSEAQDMKKVADWDLGCGGERTPNYVQRSYTPTDSDFDNEGGCKQRLYIELYNNLFMTTQKITYTLDLTKAMKLPKPSLEASSYSIVVGDTVTVTATSTVADIEYLWMARWQGGTVIEWENSTSDTWEITPNQKGKLEVTVNCRDNQNCAISDPETVVIDVRDPNEPEDLLGGFDWSGIILIVLGVVLFIVAVAVRQVPTWLKWLLIFLALGLLIWGAWGLIT